MGITYGDYLIDSGYRELTPEDEDPIYMKPRNGWRPMDEAPKSGARITLYQPGRGVFEGWWHDGFPHYEAYWMDDQDSEPDPVAWRPLLLGPYEED